jgi:REP-associated tyrosine transposase
MARKTRLFAPGVLYHVIVRGNQRQKTFSQPGDYQVYLAKVAHYRRKYEVTIHSYCLMPNHVHLLLVVFDAEVIVLITGVVHH